MLGRKRGVRAVAIVGLVVAPGMAFAWSWTDDAEGQKLDSEARHWLTTQNLCGVQLKQDYLSDLDARIIGQFKSVTDDYRAFLLSSVMRANAEYLADAKPAEVKSECDARAKEAATAGVLADPSAKPYLWGATTLGAKAAVSASTPTAPTAPPASPKLADFFGAWSEVSDACRSYKAKTEGPWFVIQDKSFTSEGGGQCKRPSYSLVGSSLTVTSRCAAEEAGYEPYKETFTLADGKLKSSRYGTTYVRCTPAVNVGSLGPPTDKERAIIGGLIAMIGKPKNDAEAIAQNTVVMIASAGTCGFQNRVSAYRKQNDDAIERSIRAAYGGKGQQEVYRIITGMNKWLQTSKAPTDARNGLCKMVDASLAHLGY